MAPLLQWTAMLPTGPVSHYIVRAREKLTPTPVIRLFVICYFLFQLFKMRSDTT